jgi:hypothetical protein
VVRPKNFSSSNNINSLILPLQKNKLQREALLGALTPKPQPFSVSKDYKDSRAYSQKEFYTYRNTDTRRSENSLYDYGTRQITNRNPLADSKRERLLNIVSTQASFFNDVRNQVN